MPGSADSRPPRGSRELAEQHRDLLEATLGVPFARGNRVGVLKNGDEIFPAMLAAIAAARTSIALLTSVYWTGSIAQRFAEALAERARSGVRVRVILDAVGAAAMPSDLTRQMQKAGVDTGGEHR
jgi:cardiolipin synthase A/B